MLANSCAACVYYLRDFINFGHFGEGVDIIGKRPLIHISHVIQNVFRILKKVKAFTVKRRVDVLPGIGNKTRKCMEEITSPGAFLGTIYAHVKKAALSTTISTL